MMTKYPNLPAMLSNELGPRAPEPAKVERLESQIKAEHPTARYCILFKNGHWILLPAGPDARIKSPAQARRMTVPPYRRPVAYCKI